MTKRFKSNTNHRSNDIGDLIFIVFGVCIGLALFV